MQVLANFPIVKKNDHHGHISKPDAEKTGFNKCILNFNFASISGSAFTTLRRFIFKGMHDIQETTYIESALGITMS